MQLTVTINDPQLAQQIAEGCFESTAVFGKPEDGETFITDGGNLLEAKGYNPVPRIVLKSKLRVQRKYMNVYGAYSGNMYDSLEEANKAAKNNSAKRLGVTSFECLCDSNGKVQHLLHEQCMVCLTKMED